MTARPPHPSPIAMAASARGLVVLPMLDSGWLDDATIRGMVQHVFRARIWEHSPSDPGSWHFLTLPAELSEDITLEAGPRKGFGSVRVEVSIGSTTWHTSLFPDASAGTFVLPVKRQVRKAEGLRAGVTCEVTLDVSPPDPG